MSVRKKRRELLRLQSAFEAEAARFHDLSLSVLYLTQMEPPSRVFRSPHHVVMLWQYYGLVGDSDEELEELFDNLVASDFVVAGVRGSAFSCYAALEGAATELFKKMAIRAGSVLSDREQHLIGERCLHDFRSNLPPDSQRKPVFVGNDNPLAIWLNHLLHHLGKTHPRYLPEVRIALEPFAASLSAIDSLLESGMVTPEARPSGQIDKMRFRVSLSFLGERRSCVAQVADALRQELGNNAVFYDNYYQPELARPNLDVLLQRIYHDNSDLVVIFICEDYAIKDWCGLEWRAIRDLIKQARDDQIMFLRFDNASIPGLFGVDGYLDISGMPAREAVSAILKRLQTTHSASDS